MSLKTAYIFLSHGLGIEPILKSLGIETGNKVLSSDKEKLTKEILKADAKDSLLIFSDDEDGFRLLEEFRFRHSVSSPFLLLSFSTQDKVVKRFTVSPKSNKPIITFGRGTYYLQMPFRIDKLSDILKGAVPLNKAEMDNIKTDYEFAMRYREDADFRHRCANLASAIRILQGAFYTGDIGKADYLSTLESLSELSWKTQEPSAYAQTIKDYIASFSMITQFPSEVGESRSTISSKVLLLDDEAETAGWDIVLKTIFDKQGYSITLETDREKFLNEIESMGELDCDVLLLDLKMPDAPERSLYLIERMSYRHPGVPIIVFSALTDLPYFRKCQEAGAFNYFAKELGSEDRNPERYFRKLKAILSSAVRLRASYVRKDKKGRTFKPEGSSYLDTIKIDNKWITRFAYKVEAVRGIAPDSAAKETNRLKDIQDRFLSWLYRQPSDGRAVSLRLMCFPEEKRVELIFIGRTQGKTAKGAQEKADIFSKDLWSFLKPFHPTYRFMPLSSEKEFLSLINAIEPQNIVNLRRMKFEIKPNRKDFFEWFYPFTTNQDSTLLATIEKMLTLKEPVFIGLTLMPHEFRAVILSKIKELKQIKDAPWEKPSKDDIGFSKNPGKRGQEEKSESITLDFLTPEEMEKTFAYIDKELKSIKEGGFLYHSFVASDDPMPTSLLENIRYDYFGPESNIEFDEVKDRRDVMAHSIKYLEVSTSDEFLPLHSLVDIQQALVLFRLPFPGIDGVKGIEEDRATIIEMPRQYPMVLDSDAFLLSEGFRDNRIESVCIQEKDLDKHLYICGKTGSGKSTLLLRLLLSVIEKGRGVCLIDPHEDLVEMALERIPENRVNDVIWFNPRDTEKPMGINFLENDGSEEQQDIVIQEFISMMFKLHNPEHMGPVFERGMRYTLLLLMATNLTLSDFARVWQDEVFRNECLKKLNPSLERHKDIIAFWEDEVEKWRGDDWSGHSTWLLSKFDRMTANKAMKSILGASKSTIDIREIMDEGKILLVSLPRGLIGEVNANLLGMIISTKIRIATLSRASMSAKDRNPFYLFIDEFQNFLSTSGLTYAKDSYDETFTSMLSEARKYKLLLILANQYMEQLGWGVRKALFGNIGSLIAFKSGVEDSKYLQLHFVNKLSAEDFRTIPSYHAYASLLMNNESLSPFTIRTIPIEDMPTNIERKTKIIKQSRERYGIKTQQETDKSQLSLSSEDWLSKAKKTDDLDEKVLFYSKAIGLAPKDHKLYLKRGNIYLAKKDYDHAIIDYTEAIKLETDFVAYNNRAFAYAYQDDQDRAIDDFTRAIELSPGAHIPYFERGRIYLDRKDYDHAIIDFTKTIKLKAKFGKAYNNRGYAYARRGEQARAMEDFTRAIELSPKDHDNIYFERGNIYLDKKDYDQAIIDFTEAMTSKLGAKFLVALTKRGYAYACRGEQGRAMEDFTKAIESEDGCFIPDFIYYYRGLSYLIAEEYDLAIEDLSYVIRIDPNKSMAYENRAKAYEKKGEHTKAKEDLGKVEELNRAKFLDDTPQFLEPL